METFTQDIHEIAGSFLKRSCEINDTESNVRVASISLKEKKKKIRNDRSNAIAISHSESWPDRYVRQDKRKINSPIDAYELHLDIQYIPFPRRHDNSIGNRDTEFEFQLSSILTSRPYFTETYVRT